MKRFKEKFVRILDTGIRDLIGRLSPEKRLNVALSLLGVMTLVFIIVVGHGVYRIGHNEALSQMQRIQSIVIPEFILHDTLPEHQQRHLDSIRYNHLNDMHDDTSEE